VQFKPKIRILTILIGMLWSLNCSDESHLQPNRKARGAPRTCGEAQTQIIRLLTDSRRQEALDRYGYVLELCGNVPTILYRELQGLANIGRQDPKLCPQVVKLFDTIHPADHIDYLRAALGLSLSCSEGMEVTPLLGKLTELETREIAHSEGSVLRQVIWEYESARLYFLARQPEEHLRHLKLGTEELCKSSVLPVAIRTFEFENKREDSPVGGTLGFWSVQPVESIDEKTRACLAKSRTEMQANLNRFSKENQYQVKLWLDWYQKSIGE